MNQLIHTPAGVRDIFGDEYERKRFLMQRIGKLFYSYGYQYIQTPSIEFYPVFDKDKGTMHASRLFRMIDADGHTLVLRPDFTPSIARAVSMYYSGETQPIRLCYQGSVFLNHTNYRGRLNESTEMGVELINLDGPEADAEIIALSVEIMKAAGLENFQISIGNVAYFYALAQEAGLDEETISEIRHLLSIKNHFGAIELIQKQPVEESVKNALLELPQLFGNEAVLERAAALTENEQAVSSVKRLQEVYGILKAYGCSEYVSFDFGMLSEYSYYTGVIFQAVTYGTGDAVIKGGRYNRFIEKFGKEAAAIGFTTLVDSVLSALQRQNRSEPVVSDRTLVLYRKDAVLQAAALSASLRKEGTKVLCIPAGKEQTPADFLRYAKENHICEILLVAGDAAPDRLCVRKDEE